MSNWDLPNLLLFMPCSCVGIVLTLRCDDVYQGVYSQPGSNAVHPGKDTVDPGINTPELHQGLLCSTRVCLVGIVWMSESTVFLPRSHAGLCLVSSMSMPCSCLADPMFYHVHHVTTGVTMTVDSRNDHQHNFNPIEPVKAKSNTGVYRAIL